MARRSDRVKKPSVPYKRVEQIASPSERVRLYLQWRDYYEQRSALWMNVALVGIGIAFVLQIAALILKGMGL